MKLSCYLFLIIFSISTLNAQFEITGVVTNDDGERLESSAVYLEGTSYGVLTNERGIYKFEGIPAGEYTLMASYLGFETAEIEIDLRENIERDFVLSGSIFGLDQIEINGTFVKKNMPFSHKNMEKEEFTNLNLGQDVPYLLKYTPSLVVTSDAGAGVGYTGMRIRGSDPSRINVTINGVPLNDSESQLVFWVDLPDFASSVQEIQIQRGVGPSTNGTSAFGASINLNTNKIRLKPYITAATSIGSFNTYKLGVSAGTGLMNNKFGIDLRYSLINSDGYIDRATSNLNSFAGTLNYVTEKSSLNFNLFTGSEVTYQAWNGLPFQFRDEDRTYNTAGTDKPGTPYSNEVDDYDQTHMQLHYNRSLSDNINLNATAHYTRGLGFFENYKGGEDLNDFNISDESGENHDIVIRRWLDNHFFGGILELDYKDLEEKHNVIFGAAVNNYIGDHYGQVIWNSRDNEDPENPDNTFNILPVEYYFNDATKLDFNTYGKWTYRLYNRFITYLDLQYRIVNYNFQGFNENGELVDQTDRLNFFNPKVGLSYLLNNDSKIYASYSVANREPNRNDYTETSVNSRPEAETLYDLEVGYTLQTEKFGVGVNVYNMVYDNQLVVTGAINDVGEYTRTNVKDSYRRGMEIDAGIRDVYGFHLDVNTTLSQNKISSFTEFIDDWDNGGQIARSFELTDLAFSPSVIFASNLGYTLLRKKRDQSAVVSIRSKYVGSQFIDNTSNAAAALDAYTYHDLLINYTLKGNRFFRQIQFNLNINNILGAEYVANAWVYRFSSEFYDPTPDDPYARGEGGSVYNLTGLYPQARRYFMAGLTFSF